MISIAKANTCVHFNKNKGLGFACYSARKSRMSHAVFRKCSYTCCACSSSIITLTRTFVLADYCLDNGRNAVPPIRMFKYLLLKSIYDLSDVDVVERSKYDMSFKYFLDMAPEDEVINPSSLTKFRKLRLKDMNHKNSDGFFFFIKVKKMVCFSVPTIEGHGS